MKMKRSQSFRNAGFSLVEIALVVGVLAVAFVPLFGLLPAGLTNFRGAMNISVCTQIAQRVVNDAAQADFDTLIDRQNLQRLKAGVGFTFRAPSIAAPSLRYFDDQGAEITPEAPPELSPNQWLRAVYQVNVRVMPQASVPASPGAMIASGDPNLALVTVQVACVPPPAKLEFSSAAPDDARAPERNLFTRQPGREVFTYSALIGRAL